MDFNHISVLYQECLDGLNIKPDGIYVDGTLGGGGHSEGILKKLTTGKLIGIDQDDVALSAASEKLKKYESNFIAYKANFKSIKDVLTDLQIDSVDGVLLDLGVSSYQLDTAERGFSFHNDAPLDMRMDRQGDFSAYNIVNEYDENELAHIIKDYGEERWAKRIAKFIVEARMTSPIKTTFQLVDIIKAAIPKGARQDGPHPARRTFQAIRIEVNSELEIIEQTIKDVVDVLNSQGRLAIITFHSLEDRIVKNTYKDLAKECICPPRAPICTCEKVSQIKIVTRKPIIPSAEEIENNARSRSAKLRIAEKK